jgi:hypothetical protein
MSSELLRYCLSDCRAGSLGDLLVLLTGAAADADCADHDHFAMAFQSL